MVEHDTIELCRCVCVCVCASYVDASNEKARLVDFVQASGYKRADVLFLPITYLMKHNKKGPFSFRFGIY